MIPIYNLCQILVLVVAWPILALLVLLRPKYRKTFFFRLGIGLQRHLPSAPATGKTVWVHALSVGEVSSARSLIVGLRDQFPDVRIVCSTTTATGLAIARTLLHDHVDAIFPSPLDLRPVVARFLRLIRPDLFILVETDFWPNVLTTLNKNDIPAILVNGRVSARSLSRYRRAGFFFRPLFRSFAHLCMQTDSDRINLEGLGVEPHRLHCLGNLKFDTPVTSPAGCRDGLSLHSPDNRLTILAGSTHEGEEDIIFTIYAELKNHHPGLRLIVAPRNPERCPEIARLATRHDLSLTLRSREPQKTADVLLVDSIGELPWLYALADIAFVGGSLVAARGHNPIEPATHGVPVLFGRHMEDFAEISRDLVAAGGALTVSDRESLAEALNALLSSEDRRKIMGRHARRYVERQQGVVARHLTIIRPYL
ncbi:3-deoxy-D-manno-octulosonic acid transferase [Desulfoprunum benzoelyticum]|uniref:3-deoxy-D-manno-octulosonic acid transferase n=1 Tax=Desulfoprunum benzoelyticum TaxID=1506996 RepID=A0A840UWS1_9BACT|nr:3-deoxy-D-manno-octulosonic acid transferase [Desulfoprunum benzoelyticum]MBB5349383.1 3-deoxy-D-manno-octulosonic-acid transferase [Desulfoprunum benzoelyticum]MBM9531043.1 3-deoxy-D-manno-octulosonic acid transferase [Desulfoprunum benzoelyticum]